MSAASRCHFRRERARRGPLKVSADVVHTHTQRYRGARETTLKSGATTSLHYVRRESLSVRSRRNHGSSRTCEKLRVRLPEGISARVCGQVHIWSGWWWRRGGDDLATGPEEEENPGLRGAGLDRWRMFGHQQPFSLGKEGTNERRKEESSLQLKGRRSDLTCSINRSDTTDLFAFNKTFSLFL